MSIPKYHHLIPQTYLRSWCFSGASVYSFEKTDLKKFKVKNISNNFGENYYHAIRAGMPCCTEEDLKVIFNPLIGYDVWNEGKELIKFTEYNRSYYNFDNWELFHTKGVRVAKATKNKLKSEIESNKILDIEEQWSIKYENVWNSLLQMIDQRINDAKGNEIDEFYKGKLMKFIVSLDWRSFSSNEKVVEAFNYINTIIDFKSVEIPREDRNIKKNETAYDEMKHNYLLKLFGAFLNDKGIIYDTAKGYIKHLTIRFLISSKKIKFITSDNPSFQYEDSDGRHHMIAVTPEILISIEKDSHKRGKYYIEHISDNEVKRINLIIVNNADKLVISKTPLLGI